MLSGGGGARSRMGQVAKGWMGEVGCAGGRQPQAATSASGILILTPGAPEADGRAAAPATRRPRSMRSWGAACTILRCKGLLDAPAACKAKGLIRVGTV